MTYSSKYISRNSSENMNPSHITTYYNNVYTVICLTLYTAVTQFDIGKLRYCCKKS